MIRTIGERVVKSFSDDMERESGVLRDSESVSEAESSAASGSERSSISSERDGVSQERSCDVR